MSTLYEQSYDINMCFLQRRSNTSYLRDLSQDCQYPDTPILNSSQGCQYLLTHTVRQALQICHRVCKNMQHLQESCLITYDEGNLSAMTSKRITFRGRNQRETDSLKSIIRIPLIAKLQFFYYSFLIFSFSLAIVSFHIYFLLPN